MIDERELRRSFQARLNPGEEILWTGVPVQGVVFNKSDILLIPFTLMWCGFAIFWEWGVLQSGAPGFMAFWGIPFILIGLYMVFGRFFADSWRRRRTTYAITPNRVIIRRGNDLESLDLRSLSDLSLVEKADGSGTIFLGKSASGQAEFFRNSGWIGTNKMLAPALERIPEAAAVYRLIQEMPGRKNPFGIQP